MKRVDFMWRGFPAAQFYMSNRVTKSQRLIGIYFLQTPADAGNWRRAPKGFGTDLESAYCYKEQSKLALYLFEEPRFQLHRERWFPTFDQALEDFVHLCDMFENMTKEEGLELVFQCPDGRLL